ncbi:MAG: NTP transferase domain-containing protein [Bacteroidetes bacterium]|nr:NTP transferase domain-containing protein [Bacteroidota bacterium]
MKAIIPVAGIGSRLKPHTHTQPKALIPVAGKPILAHIIDNLRSAGIEEFIFIIGYMGDKIENYITRNYPDQKNKFIIQTSRKGIGHAIYLAKEKVIKCERILIVLGDTIFETSLKRVLSSPTSVLGVKKVDDPRQFGVAEINSDSSIKKLVEKPLIPKSNMALVGVYYIKEVAQLFDALRFNIENKIKTQNEYHLTDALMRMIENGVIIKTFEVDNWFDCGKKEILLQTNELLLKRIKELSIDKKLLNDSIIIPPVFIGKNAKISKSVIGPNVSIGENTSIHSSIIKNSIIGPYAHIETAILQDTLIGNDSRLKGMSHTLNLGDNAEISFN